MRTVTCMVNGKDQGGIDLRTGKSAYRYTDGMIGLAHMYVRKPQQVLVIGLGAGQIGPVLEAAGIDVEVVEIDPEVVRLARQYFDFQGTAVVADGRRYLQRSDKHWDVIMVDAYLGSSPPWQLYTREAFALYRERLNPGGAVVINFIGSHLEAGTTAGARGRGDHGPRGLSGRGDLSGPLGTGRLPDAQYLYRRVRWRPPGTAAGGRP